MTGSLQVKKDAYYAVLNFRDQTGKRVQKWINLNMPVKGNKRRAEIALNELLVEYQGYEAIEPMNLLLSQHVAQWLEANRPNIAVTTYDQYFNILTNHIRPYFDSKKITVSKLTAGDLEDYYSYKVKKGLSPNSVIKHHAMIRTALQWAVKHRYIRENVADFAEKPSHVRYRGAEPYTVQEIANLLQLTASEPIAVPIFLASFYGLRRSELLGLRWSAIDFQQGTITISTTVVKEKHNGEIKAIVRENTTKSDTSMRTLPLCQYACCVTSGSSSPAINSRPARASWAHGRGWPPERPSEADRPCTADMSTTSPPESGLAALWGSKAFWGPPDGKRPWTPWTVWPSWATLTTPWRPEPKSSLTT